MDTCANCEHCNNNYCDIYDKKVDSNSRACPEFEEK